MLHFPLNNTKCLIVIAVCILFSINLKSEESRDTLYIPKEYKIKKETKGNKVYLNVDKDASLSNGENIYSELRKKIKVPKKIDKKSLQGNVAEIGIIISKDGRINNVKIIKSIFPDLDAEILKSITQLPKFIPAQKNGKSVKVNMRLSLSFPEIERPKITNDIEGNWCAFFPGGNDLLIKYISQNLKYPESAAGKGIQGRVVIRFVINEDGDIEDIEVVKSLNRECDVEALRVVKSLPRWNPAISDGKPIKIFFTIPISFKLNKKSEDLFINKQK